MTSPSSSSIVDDKLRLNNNDNLPKKVVIRRLPPTLTKESFLKIISPLYDHEYLQFCGPDKR
jgi:hypothetical protein